MSSPAPLPDPRSASGSVSLESGFRLRPPAPGKSLLDRYPWLAAQAEGWDPSRVRPGSRVALPWRCMNCSHIWSAEVRLRVRGQRGCPACRAKSGTTLADSHPALANELLVPFDARALAPATHAVVWWRGPLGHVWKATVANRVKGSGCPHCASQRRAQARQQPQPGSSMADTNPELSGEADGWDPREYRSGSNARMPWHCATCGHHWHATIFNRARRGQGCPSCAVQRRRSSFGTR